MGRRSDRKADRGDTHRRAVLAQEAARLISEHGIEDFRAAKSKAADKLGLSQYGALPTNREIESGLAERNRIFGGDQHQDMLASLRCVALQVMYDLRNFAPCLVGPVLSGNITEHSCINLHLFSEPFESVGERLQETGVRHSTMLKRLRLRRNQIDEFPGYRFFADDCEIEATVFPERGKGHAPLSPVDGRPMLRARLHEVAQLTSSETSSA